MRKYPSESVGTGLAFPIVRLCVGDGSPVPPLNGKNRLRGGEPAPYGMDGNMDCRGRLVCRPFFGTPHCVPYVLYGNLDYPSIWMGSIIGKSRRDLLHFRVAEIKELAPSSWRQANVHRTFAFDCSNPSFSAIKKNPSIWMGSFLWRSRRDLNPRYPFGVHTISSRARYDHFDTAPCGPVRCRLGYNTTEQGFCQALFFLFSKILCSG